MDCSSRASSPSRNFESGPGTWLLLKAYSAFWQISIRPWKKWLPKVKAWSIQYSPRQNDFLFAVLITRVFSFIAVDLYSCFDPCFCVRCNRPLSVCSVCNSLILFTSKCYAYTVVIYIYLCILCDVHVQRGDKSFDHPNTAIHTRSLVYFISPLRIQPCLS